MIGQVHSLGIMVNGSFVFGLDDDADVFDRTVESAISRSVETATFHITTPYPGTALHARLVAEGRITDANWDHYDTRHVVYQPRRLRPEQLLAGYRRAYRDFYRWKAIARGAAGQPTARQVARHVAHAGGWKRLEPLWGLAIRARQVNTMLPVLEVTLDAFGGIGQSSRAASRREVLGPHQGRPGPRCRNRRRRPARGCHRAGSSRPEAWLGCIFGPEDLVLWSSKASELGDRLCPASPRQRPPW